MQFFVLGPLSVTDRTGQPVTVSGRRLRRLLVRLIADAGRSVSIGELEEAVWVGEDPPDSHNALQALISRLRRLLDVPISQTPQGYLLDIGRDEVDLHVFERAASNGEVSTALELWRGEPLVDADDADYTRPIVAGLTEQYLNLFEQSVDVATLEELVAANPLREPLVLALLKALQAHGRTAEALAAYEETRVRLADELGADPGPDLQELHLTLLRGDASPVRRTNLRTPRTRFVGREEEVQRLVKVLRDHRLATLVGPGGAGKTRTATEVGLSLATVLPGGTWMVELAAVTDPSDIVATVLSSLGREARVIDRRETIPRTLVDQIVETLGDRATLLIVDNCEHLVADVALVVDELLGVCPELRVLATSREPLGIDGEVLTSLSSLPLPPAGVGAADAGAYQAVQLFNDRAAAASPDFEFDESTAPVVVDVVRRLDGLPLALELAAARLRVMPLAEVSRRLADRFALLTGGSRAALPRHQTLRAVVQWSWDLLPDDERRLVERLAVFNGGAEVDAVLDVVAGDESLDASAVPGLLDSLVDKSLVYTDGTERVRYRLLETIREYGHEQLAARGEVGTLRARHAHFYADLMAQALPRLRTFEQVEWLARIEVDREDITAAIRYLGDNGEAETALEVVYGMTWYWVTSDGFAEASQWLDYALGLPDLPDSPIRRLLAAMSSMANLATLSSRSADDVDASVAGLADAYRSIAGIDAGEYLLVALLRPVLAMFGGLEAEAEESITAGLGHSDPWVRAATSMFRANMAENSGRLADHEEDVDRAVADFREIGDRWGLAASLAVLGQLRTLQDDLPAAVIAYREAIEHIESLHVSGDGNGMHLRLGNLYLRLGDLEAAREEARLVRVYDRGENEFFADVLEMLIAIEEGDDAEVRRLQALERAHLAQFTPRHLIHDHARAMISASLIYSLTTQGDYAAARAEVPEALESARRTQDMPILASVALAAASLLAGEGDPRRAAEVLGLAANLRGGEDTSEIGYQRLTGALRSVLGADYETAYATGLATERDDALARLDTLVEPGKKTTS